jgi:hypothetical protein
MPLQTSSEPPVFATDEDALAAATEAYAAYLSASDRSWSGADLRREKFLALSTGTAHEQDVEVTQLFEERGWRKVGSTSFDSMRLQSSAANDAGQWELRAYVCVDVSRSDVLDSFGASAAEPDRSLRMPLELAFVSSTQDTPLLISESKIWHGSNFC